MPDKDEIEVKFLLDDPQELKRQLEQFGAAKKSERYEWNTRLESTTNPLLGQGKMLRIRRAERNGDTDFIVTVKVDPTDNNETSYRVRREIEFKAQSDEATLLALFNELGYQSDWHYEKRREVFIWEDVEIDLDEMPFGWFVEFEGPREGLEKLIQKLEWGSKPRVLASYQEIFRHVQAALDLPDIDLTFDNFQDIVVDPEIILGTVAH